MSDGRPDASFADQVLQSPLTWLISALNVGIFLLTWSRGSHGMSVDGDVLEAYGATARHLIQTGEPWRLLTAMFLHGSWFHMALNVAFMFGLCAAVERALGSGWFAFAYLTTGTASFAVSALVRPWGSVGASGAAYGILAVFLALRYLREGSWDAFIANPVSRSILTQAGGWILISYFLLPRVDNAAHIGGFIFGVPCGLVLGNRQGRRRPAWIASLAAYVLVWVGLVVVACRPGMGLNSGE